MKLKVEVTIVESQDFVDAGKIYPISKALTARLFSYAKTIESPVLTLEMSVDSKLDLIDAISSIARKEIDLPGDGGLSDEEIKEK